MSLNEIYEVATAVILSFGGSAVILVGCSNWLGKIWADRLMQKERAIYEIKFEELRTGLKFKADSELELMSRNLDISVESHIREVKEKIAIYRLVVDIVANFLADLDLERHLYGQPLSDSNERMDKFNRDRIRAYGYMAMFAPQDVMNAFDELIDHLFLIKGGQITYDWSKVRSLAIIMINAIRADIGLDKSPIGYFGRL